MLSEYHRDLLVVIGLALAAAQTLIAFIALFLERRLESSVEKIGALRKLRLPLIKVALLVFLSECLIGIAFAGGPSFK